MGSVTPEAIAPVIVFLVAAPLEMFREWRPISTSPARRWTANISLFALCFGVGYVMAPMVAALVQMTDLPLGPAKHIHGAVLRAAAAVICLDLLDYGLHHLSHRVSVLWRMHQPHHSDLDLDVTTALRHHPFEAAVTSVVMGGGGALLGFAPREIAIYGAVALSVQIMAHANLNLPRRLSNLLAPVFVVPDFHRLHHSQHRFEADANYGQVFSIWDRLFGTQRTEDARKVSFGIDGCLDARCQHLLRILAQPMLQ
jgi:sterol desaturase/sphingolipid hydroxylase (fatty acid hydroxylase superfamily)